MPHRERCHGGGQALSELRALVRGIHPRAGARHPPARWCEASTRAPKADLRAAIAARTQLPGLPVLVLSQHVEQLYAKELLSAGTGGLGYLLKDWVSDVLGFIEAVRTVAGGGTAMDPEVVTQLLARHDRDEQLGRIFPREREVLAVLTYLNA